MSVCCSEGECDLALTIFQKEHLAIRQGKRPEDPIDWEDFKAMRFTRAVSILRLASVEFQSEMFSKIRL